MKILRKISLEGLDNLSIQEKARLYGGTDNDSIPTVTPSLPPITVTISPAIIPTGITMPVN